MKLGMIGLGRMGGNMLERLRKAGHEVIGFSRTKGDVESLEELVRSLDTPRIAWMMLPAGEITEETFTRLMVLLEPGDVIVDGANSNYNDSIRRAEMARQKGIGFVDAGVSGGIWGLTEGYCLMVGGEREQVELLQPIFDALAPEGGFVHCGRNGAGHFTKMVHNGVEYGMMQAFGEGYELLKASELEIDVPAALAAWRSGSVVRSWLLDLLADAIQEDPALESVTGWAEDSGEGRWTVQEAVRLAVPLPVISAALYARFASRQDDSEAMKVVAMLRKKFGGHATKG